MLAWLRLARVFQKLDRSSTDQLKGWGLSVAQFDVLAHVGTAEGCTQQQLADQLLVTKGNVTQLLDRLEQRGLISRHQRGRANCLYLTRDGRKLYDEVVPAHEDFIDEQLSTLSPEEQEQLLGLLRKLDHALEG